MQATENKTCFSTQAQHNVNCERRSCPHWINHKEGNNCVVITAQRGPSTLQTIGDIFDLTRMKIFKIEKSIFDYIRKIN